MSSPSVPLPCCRKYANGFEVENIKQGPASGKIAKPGKKVSE